MDDEDEGSPITFQVIFFVILAALWIFFIRADASPYVLKAGWTEVIFLVLVFFAGLFPVWRSRYLQPHVCVDGSSGSFNHNSSPQPVEDFYVVKGPDGKPVRKKFVWLVYGLGFSMFPLPTRGKLETLIVPKLQMDTRAKNHYGSTHVRSIPYIQLPPVLHNFFVNHPGDYNLDNIKIGYHDLSFQPKDSFDDADKDLQIQQLQAQVNSKSKMLSGDFDEFEKIKKINDIVNPKPSFSDKLTNIFKRNPSADSDGSS